MNIGLIIGIDSKNSELNSPTKSCPNDSFLGVLLFSILCMTICSITYTRSLSSVGKNGPVVIMESLLQCD